MKNFIKENWFRLGVLTFSLILVTVFGLYLTDKNKLEKERFANELIEKQQKKFESDIKIQEAEVEKQQIEQGKLWINNCIADAYAGLKSLQSKYDAAKIRGCSENIRFCDDTSAFWDNAKDEAFVTYEKEWVAQCKLGNKVFKFP